jgi:hypothetical protein
LDYGRIDKIGSEILGKTTILKRGLHSGLKKPIESHGISEEEYYVCIS